MGRDEYLTATAFLLLLKLIKQRWKSANDSGVEREFRFLKQEW